MKNARALVALALISVFLAGLAYANTSGVNPNVPAQNSPLSSSVFRGQFAATASDINTIYGILTLSSNQILGTVNAGNAGPLNLPTCSTGALSWTPGSGFGCNSITGLTSPVTQALVFTGVDAFNLNAASLPTKQVGTVLQLGNADTIASRIENDAFANTAYFTGVRSDGTNAAPTALQNNDEISGINAWGYNGSSIVGPKASVREYAAQTWTGSANGTYVDIATSLNGTTTMNEAVRIENDGGITVPATVTGGDQGAGKINAAGLFVNGVAVSVGGSSFSTLTAATTTNSIENGANAQTWNWDTTTTGTALTLSSTGMTTGILASHTIVNPASTGYAGYFSNTGTAIAYGVYGVESGAANTGYAGYFANTATATGYALYANGTAKVSGNLTVTGTCTGCGSSGSLVEIGGPQTASSSASLQWTGLGSTYNNYELDCSGMVSANGLVVQYGEGGTPTWEATNYNIASVGQTPAAGSPYSANGVNQSGMAVIGNGTSAATAGSATVKIIGVPSTTSYKIAMGSSFYPGATTNVQYFNSSGAFYYGDTNAITAIRVIPTSGTITSGTCSLYGIAP